MARYDDGAGSPRDTMNLAYHERTSAKLLDAEVVNQRHNAGQVFTPLSLAQAGAETIDFGPTARHGRADLHIVDAGIGDGQLTLAVLARLGEIPREDRPETIRITGVELDHALAEAARSNLETVTPWCRDQGVSCPRLRRMRHAISQNVVYVLPVTASLASAATCVSRESFLTRR